jgi:hypothetical protein
MEINNQIFNHYEVWLKEAKELLEKNGYKVINLRTYNK